MSDNEFVKKAEEELEYLNGDEEERRLAELREKAIRDEAAAIAGALRRGEKNKSIQIAKKMLEEKIEIKMIIKLTGLTKKEIENL